MLQFACSQLSTSASLLAFGCGCFDNPPSVDQQVMIDDALDVASDMIALLSGMRVFGVCTKTVYPFGDRDCWGWGDPYDVPYGWPPFAAGVGYFPHHTPPHQPFGGLNVIPLRGPNTHVTNVTIGGVTLDPTNYRLLDGRFLLRIDGGSWPAGNNVAPGAANGWTVTYTFGRAGDKITRDAVDELACELIKSWTGRTSLLPPGIVGLNLQGVSATIQDSADSLRDGAEGMTAVSRFLGVYNPGDVRGTIGVWSPELEQGWELIDIGLPNPA